MEIDDMRKIVSALVQWIPNLGECTAKRERRPRATSHAWRFSNDSETKLKF